MSVNPIPKAEEKKVPEDGLPKAEGVQHRESVKKSTAILNGGSIKKISIKKRQSKRRKRILYPSQAGKLETELVIV